jgi:hypothetical protein
MRLGLRAGRWLALASIVAISGCGGSQAPGKVPAKPAAVAPSRAPSAGAARSAEPTREPPTGKPAAQDAAKKPPSPHTVVPRGKFLACVPENSLFAMRVPAVGSLKSAWKQTAIAKLLDHPALQQAMASATTAMSQGWQELQSKLPHGNLDDLLSCFSGEALFAVYDFDFASVSRSDEPMPCSVVLFVETSADTAALTGFLDSIFAAAPAAVVTSGSSWKASLPMARIEVSLSDGRLAVLVAPAQKNAEELRRLMSLPSEQTLLASDIVQNTPGFSSGLEQPLSELYFNLAPIWKLARAQAPTDVSSFLTKTNLEQLCGISAVCSLAGDSIHEITMLHSPAGTDLVTRLLGAQQVDSQFARYIPKDVAAGQLLAFDVGAACKELVSLLPIEAQADVDRTLGQLKSEAGIDLRHDLLENLGPNFAFASRGSIMGLMSGKAAFDWLLAAQVKDAKRITHFAERMLVANGVTSLVSHKIVNGKEIATVSLPPMPLPNGSSLTLKPAWCISEQCVVLGSDMSMVERSLAAASDGGNSVPEGLKQALAQAGDGASSVGFADGKAQLGAFVLNPALDQIASAWTSGFASALEDTNLPTSIQYVKTVSGGVQLESRSATGMMLTGCAVGGTVVAASVAIPKLLAARMEQNEQQAKATLRKIAAAEDKARSLSILDRDHDGHPEYGRLVDLARPVPAQGRADGGMSQILDVEFQPNSDGCVEGSGYLFRVDFPPPPENPAAPKARSDRPGGTPPTASATTDVAETQFIAYAWPREFGSTGLHVFALDASGQLYYSDNRAPGQSYSGTAHPPAPDASLPKIDRLSASSSFLRRGRDGALWVLQD